MTSSGLRADSVLCSVSDLSGMSLNTKAYVRKRCSDRTYNPCPVGGAAPSVPVCLQLTEEDLEASKLDPKQVSSFISLSVPPVPLPAHHKTNICKHLCVQVQKNLRETSQENLMEHSQKFGSVPQTSNLHHSMEVTSQEEPGPPSSIQPLPKQQNLPQRPTSLHLLPKPSESRLKLGRLRSTHRQVETGVAKMNTVIPSAEPHLVTTVTNMRTANGNEAHCASSSHSSGVPILVTNKTRGIGKTNPAGPQEEEVDEVRRKGGDGDSQLNLNLNFSPDEHEPLLRREQLPAESDPPPPPRLHHGPPSRAGGRGSNSNNNNNRLALGSEVHLPAEVSVPEPEPRNREPPAAVSVMGPKILISGLETLLVHPAGRGEGSDTETCQKEVKTLTGGFLGGLQEQISASSATLSKVHQNPTLAEIVATGVPLLDISTLEAKALDPASAEGPTSEPAGLQNRSSEPQTAGVLQSQLRQTKTRRPERPCSLDLSSSCISSGGPASNGFMLSVQNILR
ncbi:hypothetical protein ILYODFUR_036478 [Ilyodon furcidens]|uniref:Uncharacterized protein n=1 Tax=Ilyodon furcidens TaxID=33524 RepID=A0ABV0T3B8_9TELE